MISFVIVVQSLILAPFANVLRESFLLLWTIAKQKNVHAVSIVLRNVFCCFSACQEQICILITSEDGALKGIEDSLLLFLGFPESPSWMCLQLLGHRQRRSVLLPVERKKTTKESLKH